MIDENRMKRLRFRAWHRGTKEADLMVGGFFDRYAQGWSGEEAALFEALLDEEDHDLLAWMLGVVEPPAHYAGPMMAAMQRLDYVAKPE